jgi:molecular chaperone GrpE
LSNDTPTTNGEPPEPEEKASRFDNAKAFFRALNAGADAAPDDYGINLGQAANATNERTGPCRSCENLEQLRAEAEAKANEAESLYKRMAADFENYRKRTDREREDLRDLGLQMGVKEILPALDDLDRAQAHYDESSDPRVLFETLGLLYNRFLKCFELLGVKPIEVLKQPFDPRLHEPVQQIETDAVPEGHIAHELRRGYAFKDKVIRPALVNVASAPSPNAKVASEASQANDHPANSSSDESQSGQIGVAVPEVSVIDATNAETQSSLPGEAGKTQDILAAEGMEPRQNEPGQVERPEDEEQRKRQVSH